MSIKDKSSQLPKVSNTSEEEGGTAFVPGEEGCNIPLVIAFVEKVLGGEDVYRYFCGGLSVTLFGCLVSLCVVSQLFFAPCKLH